MNANDRIVHDALHQLPTPDHRPGFWSDLDAQMAAEPTEADYANVTTLDSRRRTGVVAGILGAAAVVLVALVIGFAMNDDDGVTTPGPATDPTVRQTVAPSSLVPATTAMPATTTAVTVASTLVDQASPDGWVVVTANELFRYHIAAPSDWTQIQSYGQATYVNRPAADNGFRIDGLEVVSFFPGDEPSDLVTYFAGSTPVVADEVREVRLWGIFSDIDGAAMLDETASVRQVTYATTTDGGGYGQVMRVAELGDRTIVSSVRFDADEGVPGGWTPEQILDGVRIEDSRGTVAPASSCSADGMAIPPTPSQLNPAQAARFEAITAAVTACDWTAIEAQLSPDGFTASFGGGEPIVIWQNEERYGGVIMRRLIEHLSVPVTLIEETGTAAWPRATNIVDWSDPDPEILAELEALGYSTDLSIFDEIGYLGYRTGITEAGEWTYFVAGD